MANMNAINLSRTDLETVATQILTSHSLADVCRRTAMSYANLWNLRKSADNIKKAHDRTLIAIINAFPEQ